MQYSDFKWIIQKTMTGQETLRQLTNAVEQNDAVIELIDVPPFDSDIQYVPQDDRFPIIYGSGSFVYGCYQHPYLRKGVFYNPETFRMSTYLQNWGSNMLNSDAVFVKAAKLSELNYPMDYLHFVRPDDDSKSFSGMVCNYKEIVDRFSHLDASNPYLNKESELFFSSVKEIDCEWRCFIGQGKVISATRYRILGETIVSETDVPELMISFAEKMCRIFTPHDIFVMDVASYQGEYKIVECNCFNGSGTYQNDWSGIVKAIHEFIINSGQLIGGTL
jgi:hypothetical protein